MNGQTEQPTEATQAAPPDEISPPEFFIGWIVHYLRGDGTVAPGIVTHVHDDGTVDLTIFTREGHSKAFHGIGRAAEDAPAAAGEWFWPPRV